MKKADKSRGLSIFKNILNSVFGEFNCFWEHFWEIDIDFWGKDIDFWGQILENVRRFMYAKEKLQGKMSKKNFK